MAGKVWDCPSTATKGETMADYGYNGSLAGVALGDVTNPESRLALADLVRAATGTATLRTPKEIDRRHNSGAITAYVDGHVAYAKDGFMLKALPAGNPKDVLFWLMADDGVDATGTAVTEVQDWGPALANAKAPSSGKPTLVKNALNGLPVLQFDGVNDVLTGTLDTTTSVATLVTVVNMVTIADSDGILTLTDGISAQDYTYAGDLIFQQYDRTGITGTRLLLNGTSSILGPYGATDFPPGVFHLISLVIEGTKATFYVNGKKLGPTTITSAERLWKFFVVSGRCSASTPNGWANNEIAEMLLYKSALSSAQLALVEGYLKAKYGL